MTEFSIIVATDSNNGIGKNNNLPWPKFKSDMKWFKEKTTSTIFKDEQNVVIMGKNTWLSIPEKFRPLPERINIVISKTLTDVPEGVIKVSTLERALQLCDNLKKEVNKIFVIGGGILYNEAIKHPSCVEIILTKINNKYDCDTYFPNFDKQFILTSEEKIIENEIDCSFQIYRKC